MTTHTHTTRQMEKRALSNGIAIMHGKALKWYSYNAR